MSDPMREHHRPNILPPAHEREDYDFDYDDGVAGPIRSHAVDIPDIPIHIAAKVWCRRHGWEEEMTEAEPELPPVPDAGYYLDKDGYCWRFDGDDHPIGFGDEVNTPWRMAHQFGPFVRLVPQASGGQA
jgi:hypothetical protein